MEPGKKPNVLGLFLKKVASPIVVITAMVLAVKEVPGVPDFLKWAFEHTGTTGQISMVVIAGIEFRWSVNS